VSTYCVYIIECQNGTLYTGITTDLTKRYAAHCQGTGAHYTKSFPPKALLIAWEIIGGRSEAQRTEHHIKRLSRIKKNALIKDPHPLKHPLTLAHANKIIYP